MCRKIILFVSFTLSCLCGLAYNGYLWIDFNMSTPYYFSSESQINSLLHNEIKDTKLHYLTFQIIDSDSSFSTPFTQLISFSIKPYSFSYYIDGVKNSSYSDNQLDVENLSVGFHSLYIIDNKANLPNYTFNFYKKPSVNDALSLYITDEKGAFNQTIKDISNDLTLNVSSFPIGFNKLNFNLACSSNKYTLLSTNLWFYKHPLGGNGIASLRFYNSNRTNFLDVDLGHKNYPLEFHKDIDVSSLDSISSKSTLKIFDTNPYSSPVLNLDVCLVDNRGSSLDSITEYVDNSHATRINPITLYNGVQYDFSMPVDTVPLWVSFNNLASDAINFRARYDCDATLFSPDAVLLQKTSLSKSLDNFNFVIPEDGRYYLSLCNIKKSYLQFSVKYQTLSGPSVDSLSVRPTFTGEHIWWEDSSEWTNNNESLEFSTPNIIVNIQSLNSRYGAYFDCNTLECKLNSSGVLNLFSKENQYLTKAIFVPQNLNDSIALNALCSNGNLSIDMSNNVIIWDGFSKSVSFFPDSTNNDTTFNIRPLKFREIYVTYAPINSTDFEIDTENHNEFNYGDGYNTLFVITSDGQKNRFEISDKLFLSFIKSNLVVNNAGVKTSFPSKGIILLYENTTGITEIDYIDPPLVYMDNGNLIFSNLPNDLFIYSINGILVFHENIISDSFSLPLDRIGKGIFIISIGNKSAKIIVR